MQALLNDIELDVQELKCLMQSISADANPVLKIVAKRNIHQMQERLDALTKLLDAAFVITPAGQTAPDTVQGMTESDVVSEPVAETPVETAPVSDIAAPASPSGPPYWLIINCAIFGFVCEIFTGYCRRFSYLHISLLPLPTATDSESSSRCPRLPE